MHYKARKHIWPVAWMSLAVFGVLAVVVALSALQPQAAQADGCDAITDPVQRAQCDARHRTAGLDHTDSAHSHGGNGGNGDTGMAGDMIASSSTTGDASVTLTLTLADPGAFLAGSSVVLYLEDDFQVDDIDMDRVYFVGRTTGRVYVTDAVVVSDDDHFGGDDDWDIQVFVPDMNPGNDTGFDRWSSANAMGIRLVLDKAGVKNPTEAGKHTVGYSVLGASGSVGDPEVKLDDVADSGAPLETLAKINLSDEDAGRGKEITVAGTGFNNGTVAEVFVLVSSTEPTCETVVDDGDLLGTADVGGNDKFDVKFTVHQDEFDAGAVNYICAADSEAGSPRFASAVKVFKLEASVTVDPASASFGDEVTLKPRDFVDDITVISVGPTMKWTSASGDTNDFSVTRDDSDYVFDLPGGLDERVQIAVTDGDQTKRIYLGVNPSSLSLSESEVSPNQSIVISGSGYNEGRKIWVDKITLDGKPLNVDNAGTLSGERDGESIRYVTTTSNGSFTVTARVWADGDSNPALDDDEYTIKVVDEDGFDGEAEITILEPTVSVSPEMASPRDFIVIRGMNWPVSTADDDHEVTIEVDGRNRTANIDGNGRFRYEYQLRSTIKIGDEHDVTVSFEGDGGDIEEDGTFNVTEAELGLTPAMAAPGQTVSVDIKGMPPYTLVAHVNIDGANRLGGRNVNTDREGNAMVSDILVPFLDPGFYPVEVKVGEETRVAQLEVLAEAVAAGVAAELPDAVSALGDNLVAMFYWNDTTKEWSFYDPRPEFAGLNTLTEMVNGEAYWILVSETVDDGES